MKKNFFKKNLKYVFLTIITLVITFYLIYTTLGTKIAFSIYGVKKENIVYDQTYKEFTYDVSQQKNYEKVRFVLYMDKEDSSLINMLCLRYTPYTHQIVKIVEVRMNGDESNSKEVYLFPKKGEERDPFIENKKDSLEHITLSRYSNDNPEEIKGKYDMDNLIGNGSEIIHLYLGYINTDQEENIISSLHNGEIETLYSSDELDNRRYVFLQAIEEID